MQSAACRRDADERRDRQGAAAGGASAAGESEMSTGIQWTDETWNPVTGCSKVSPGCAHCYAETVALRFWPSQYVHTVERGLIAARDYNGERMTGTPRQFTDVMCHEDRLDQPLRWR